MGQYLAQTRNIEGELSRELVSDISLSERAHLAYQALSRGCCRFVDNGQAVALSKVMPGVTWTNWKPVFLPETDSLVETWTKIVSQFLLGYEPFRGSSRKLKMLTGADKLTKSTWQRVLKAVCESTHAPKKEHMGDEHF